MRALVAGVIAIAAGAGACRRAPRGPTVTITALAGDQPMLGATVVTHHANGDEIDGTSTDASGRAIVVVAPDALVSIAFTGGNAAQIATVLAPPAGGELDVHGPSAYSVPIVAGVLTIAPAQQLPADYFDIELGCVRVRALTLPATVDVSARCVGTDSAIDVVVAGYAAGSVAGYAAARLPFGDGAATFAFPSWTSASPTVAITVAVPATLAWTLSAGAMAFPAPPGVVWAGLPADGATLIATAGTGDATQTTTAAFTGVPPAIALAATDFLPPIAPSVAVDALATLALHGGACDAATGAAATNVRVAWQDGGANVWDLIVPPGAFAVALPPVFVGPPATATPTAVERCIASSDVADFTALAAGGVYVEDPLQPSSIAHAPSAGELRVSQVVDHF
jgi:hypothetical protein